MFAPHAKRGPADRFPATAILGTGIVLSAATLVSSLVFYFHPLDFSNTRKSPAVAADSTAPPEDTAETGPGGGEAMPEPAPEPESASGADSGPGTAGGDGPRVVGSDETEDPDAPHEVGQMTDLDMEAFVTGEGIVYSAILDTAMGPMVYYSQGDARWRDFLYGGADPMKKYGCGPTAVAMLVSSFSLEGGTVNPQDMAEWAAANGHFATHSGSYHSLIPQALAAYGLQVESVGDRSPENAQALLDSGHILVALMGKGSLTENGHFVLITRMQDNGYVSIADPNRYENCKKDWDLEALLSELKPNFDSGGPLWAVSTG